MDEVVVIPEQSIKNVILDPVSDSVIIQLKDNDENIIIKDKKVTIVKKGAKVTFKSFEDFKKFINENLGLKILPGGKLQ